MSLKLEFDELLEHNKLDALPAFSYAQMEAELVRRKESSDHPASEEARATLEAIEALKKHAPGDAEQIEPNEIIDGTGRLSLALHQVNGALDELGIDIPHQLYFNTYPTEDFNAVAIGARSGVLCLLNFGVPRLVYAVAKALSFAFSSQSQSQEEGQFLSVTLLCKCVSDYITHAKIESGIPNGWSLEENQIHFSNALAVSMKCFIVAHEVGHAALGHVHPDPNWRPEDVGPLMHLAGWDTTSLHACEFDADSFAQRVLNKIDLPMVGTGGVCTFYLLLIIRVVAAKLAGVEYDPDDSSSCHPATLDRISNIGSLFSRRREDELGDLAHHLFRNAYETIQGLSFEQGDGTLTLRFA